MASKLQNHSEISLYIKFLQILIVITAVYSEYIVDHLVEIDVAEYLEKMNANNEAYANVKKYLEEVDNVRTEFDQKKVFDGGPVLKLLEPVDLSLLSDSGHEAVTTDQVDARDFKNFSRNNVLRSLASSKALRETLIGFMKRNTNVYDRSLKSKKSINDEKLKEAFWAAFSGFSLAQEVVQDSFEPVAKSLVEMLEKFKLVSKEVNDDGLLQDSPGKVANQKEPFWSTYAKEILPAVLDPSKNKSIDQERSVVERLGEVMKRMTDGSRKSLNSSQSFQKNFPDDATNKMKDYFKEARIHLSQTSSLDERVQYFIKQFNNQNLSDYGIEPSDVIEMAFTVKRQIINDENFWKIAMTKNVKELLSVFPECLRTLITSKKLCLLNRKYGIFLYAPAGPIFYYDAYARYVFGWDGPAQPGKADFFAEYLGGDEFLIKSRFYNEYMYASDIRLNRNKRLVLQWLDGKAINGSVWKLQMANNDCSLLNENFNEYLCLDDNKQDTDRRLALTCPKNVDQNAKFIFINCDYH